MKNIKKMILSVVLTGGFILSTGAFSDVNAQDWSWQRQHRHSSNQVDRNGNIDRNHNGIDDRYEVRGRVDRNRNGIPDQDERNWTNRNGNRYRNNNRNGYYDRFGRFHRY